MNEWLNEWVNEWLIEWMKLKWIEMNWNELKWNEMKWKWNGMEWKWLNDLFECMNESFKILSQCLQSGFRKRILDDPVWAADRPVAIKKCPTHLHAAICCRTFWAWMSPTLWPPGRSNPICRWLVALPLTILLTAAAALKGQVWLGDGLLSGWYQGPAFLFCYHESQPTGKA